ncbi:uncharacterized protein Z519_11728 [Cladophialophora bantiana CBS 173.52]|uniref:Ankyrin n=1 Tax=Cladophialophora bantiana (strain ATCC 10958 / CBS 173.52 / CDC B-1940 / NIH 8579) TaxID=1442370 RepID=A0A0D2HTI9_CLAB1|nr:uncharacterized protein Z519_11728 [Cladophialophora bantiana CBS 173.52]KIW87754.1 hypothetical protein Z519_11728 [Cladophialophora bantiana CBS 173.52]
MAPTSAYIAIRLIDPLLLDCVKAHELLTRVDNLDEGLSHSADRLEAPLIGIEKSLVGILVLLLNRTDRLRHPFRETSREESCFKAALRGCSNVMATIIYNLNLLAARKSPIVATWDDSQILLEVYQNALLELSGMLSPTGPSTSDFLEKINKNNNQASRLKRIVDDRQKQEQPTKARDQGQKDRPADVHPEAQAPKKEQTNGTKATANTATTQASVQSTHADAPTSSTQSHDDCTGYRRGLKEGRSGVCHTFKRLHLFENEAPRGKRASWLLKAIDKDGNKDSTEIVELLLELGADPNQLSSNIDCEKPIYLPLCYAASTGNAAIMELLIKKGADIRARDSSGDTVLLRAARYGKDPLVKVLLNAPHNADIEVRRADTTDRKGFTPLMMAVYYGHLSTVRLLLEKGANREVVDEAGNPLLHVAIRKGRLEIIKHLVEKGVQVATVNTKSHDTTLHCAIRNGSIEVVKYIIEKGPALINTPNKNETPLALAAREKRLDLIEPLVKNGARTEAKDHHGRTPLHNAVLAKDMEMLRRLVKVGAKVETHDTAGRTPLHSAVVAKDVASIKVLFELGAKIDCSDNNGQTPLHQAVMSEDLESVGTLLTFGRKIEMKDGAGKYPLQYVMEMPKSKEASALNLLREFLKVHERKKPFHNGFHALSKATRDGRLVLVQEILRSDPELVTWRPSAGNAFQLSLHEAVKANKMEVLKELCISARDLSAIDIKDHRGNTALHQSIISDRPSMIPLLIRNGANKELPSGEADGSLPPLHLAAREMNLKAIEVLLRMNADGKRRIPGGPICDRCSEMRVPPHGRNARCILRNLDPSVRLKPNFRLIEDALLAAIRA